MKLIEGVPLEMWQEYGREAVRRLDAVLSLDGFDKRYSALQELIYEGPRPKRRAAIIAVIVHLAAQSPIGPTAPAPKPEAPKPSAPARACALPVKEAAA